MNSTLNICRVGSSIEAGLPNITGYFINDSGGFDGCFYSAGTVNDNTNNTNQGSKDAKIAIDASRSSTIYGSSTTVTPSSLVAGFYIKYL